MEAKSHMSHYSKQKIYCYINFIQAEFQLLLSLAIKRWTLGNEDVNDSWKEQCGILQGKDILMYTQCVVLSGQKLARQIWPQPQLRLKVTPSHQCRCNWFHEYLCRTIVSVVPDLWRPMEGHQILVITSLQMGASVNLKLIRQWMPLKEEGGLCNGCYQAKESQCTDSSRGCNIS